MFNGINVNAKTAEISTFDEFVKYAQREDTEEEKVTEIKLMRDIRIDSYAGIIVEDGLTIDLNGKKLDINESLFLIMYGAASDGSTFYDNVNYGDSKELTITANQGYKIVKVSVDNQNKELTNNKLTISNITSNIEVEVVVKKIVYNFLAGANQTYTISKDKELRFRIDADYSLFNNLVYVDDKLVNRNNYTSENGSAIITLKQSYLDTLKVGEHNFKVEFSDGAELETKFTVAKLKNQETNPETFDNINNIILIGIISLIILIITIIYFKKRNSNKIK